MMSEVVMPSSWEMSLTVDPEGTLTRPGRHDRRGLLLLAVAAAPAAAPPVAAALAAPPATRGAGVDDDAALLAGGTAARTTAHGSPGVAYAFSIASSSTLTSPSTTSMPAFLRWARTSSTLVLR